MDTHRLIDAAKGISDVMHELEAEGLELTAYQDNRWTMLTMVILEWDQHLLAQKQALEKMRPDEIDVLGLHDLSTKLKV